MKIMTTINQILSEIRTVNASVNEISSLGTYVSNSSKQAAEYARKELTNCVSTGSTAYNILTSDQETLSEKQLLCIAYELQKNAEYCEALSKRIYREEAIAQQKRDESKAKINANKDASQDVLASVKAAGLKLGDYYVFVKSNKKYAKEFYSKKFTAESANEFINQ